LSLFNIKRDAASISLKRLEGAGLIKIQRKVGQRPIISIIHLQDINGNLSSNQACDASIET
jgi:hypothetical protein